MVKTVHKFKLNVGNNFGWTKNWTFKGKPKWSIWHTLLFRIGFPAPICRTGRGGAAPPYNLESVITGHTGSNLVFEELYPKHLGTTSSPPLLHTKNQNAKRLGANYRTHMEQKVTGRAQQVEAKQPDFHFSDFKDYSPGYQESSGQGRPWEAVPKHPCCFWPDPPCLHPAGPTAGTAIPVTSWLQPNHICFPLTQLLSLLTNQLPEASICTTFCMTPYAHSICCAQLGYALQTAVGFRNKITHWHS